LAIGLGAKAARKMLVKLGPVVNFINILGAAFVPMYSCAKKLQSQTVTREKLCKIFLYKKCRVLNVDEIVTWCSKG